MRAVSRGFGINYIAEGEGEPLVMLPGFLESVHRYEALGYVKEFAQTNRVIVLDPLGHGQSDKPHDFTCYESPGVIDDVVAVLDAEGLSKAHIWGYSRGASISYGLATLYPERIDGLICGGASFFGTNGPPAPVGRRAPPAEALDRGDWSAFWKAMGIDENEPTARALQEGQDSAALAAVMDAMRQLMSQTIDLSSVRGRALVYAGTEDRWLTAPGATDNLRDQAEKSGVKVELLPGLRHGEAAEAVQQVAPFVRDFLMNLRA